MSFYNADPRAYFQWVEVTEKPENLDQYEVGRLIKVESEDGKTFQIYKIAIKDNKKELEEINFTNQNIVSAKKEIKIGNASLEVDENGSLTFNGNVLTTAEALKEGITIEYSNKTANQGSQTIGTITAYEGKTELTSGKIVNEYPVILPKTITQETSINSLNTNNLNVVNKIVTPTIDGKNETLSLYPSGITKIGAHDWSSGISQGLQLGEYKIAILNEEAYDELNPKDPNTLYFVIPDPRAEITDVPTEPTEG